MMLLATQEHKMITKQMYIPAGQKKSTYCLNDCEKFIRLDDVVILSINYITHFWKQAFQYKTERLG